MSKTKNIILTIICLMLALVLITACGKTSDVPAQTQASPESGNVQETDGVYKVSTTEEFLLSIGSDRTIVLAPGEYNLSQSVTIGQMRGLDYHYEEVYDGYQLVIDGVYNLTIEGSEDTVICTDPRYANVIKFDGCRYLTLKGFTAGHTDEPGYCQGGVIEFDNCEDVFVESCALYGCGTCGIWAENTDRIQVTSAEIYECSFNAVWLECCRDATFENCTIRNISNNNARLFSFDVCTDINVSGCEIFGCNAQSLLCPGYSSNIYFTGNLVRNSTFTDSVFHLKNSAVVDNCEFRDCSISTWYDGDVKAVNSSGEELSKQDLIDMKLGEPITPEKSEPVQTVSEYAEYHVGTPDELLAAIGPNRTIYLEEGTYDLASASLYGKYGSEYYYWRDCYDGPELVIKNVSDLTIISPDGNSSAHTITASPRYANVIAFENCEGIYLHGFTAGHTEAPGECSGGVIFIQNCKAVAIENCCLYGCGILGVQSFNSQQISVSYSLIRDCTFGGISMYDTHQINIFECVFRDLGGSAASFNECSAIDIEGERYENGEYNIVDGQVSLLS